MRVILYIIIGFSLSFANIAVDKKTGLMWQDDNEVKSVKKDFQDAQKYCKDLKLENHDDWFLPTVEQLLNITDKSRYKPSIKSEFRNTTSSDYWSSSPVLLVDSYAWRVGFESGNSRLGNKEDKLLIRCVRIGKYETLNFESLVSNLIEKELKSIPKPPSELKLLKDEFETTLEFQVRVKNTKTKQQEEIEKYKKNHADAKIQAKQNAIKKALEVTWGKPLLSNLKYDADNGYFIADINFEAKSDFSKKVAIKVDRKNARAFKKDFNSLKPQAIFDYDGNSVKLKDIRIPYKEKTFIALFTDMNIDDTRVAVNIKNDVSIDSSFNSSVTVSKNEVNNFDSSKLNNFRELDNLLKNSKQVKQDKKKWLFVVGIEKYEFTDNISYAKRSADMFVKTAQKRLGVPKVNSYVLINNNASQAKIKTSMKKMLRRVKKGDTIYFYYNGHGVPVPSLKNEPFILASNTEPDFVADESFFALKNIYAKLSDSKAQKIVAVVDSCFSGVTDGKAVLKGVAATKMVAKSVKFDKEKMVVISAGKGNQYSNGYDKKAHRLFSFYIMKNIIEGDTDIKTLYKDTKSQTYDTSLEEYGDSRTQEPTIDGNFRLSL
jgi:Protein of unknown function (DUF1566)